MKRYSIIVILASLLLTSLWLQSPKTAEINIAVASNFLPTAQKLVRTFEKQFSIQASISSGSTGQLFAQITQGAPFDVFFAADQKSCDELVIRGHATRNNTRIYAVGRLVLFDPDHTSQEIPKKYASNDYRYIAIANPTLAPYGWAAQQVMNSHPILLTAQVLRGNNARSSLNYAMINRSTAAFTSLALTKDLGDHHWLIPQKYYSPILQKSALLSHGASKASAQKFWAFISSPRSKEILKESGYSLPVVISESVATFSITDLNYD
jgi:molybdate transport system substrate-binding protein